MALGVQRDEVASVLDDDDPTTTPGHAGLEHEGIAHAAPRREIVGGQGVGDGYAGLLERGHREQLVVRDHHALGGGSDDRGTEERGAGGHDRQLVLHGRDDQVDAASADERREGRDQCRVSGGRASVGFVEQLGGRGPAEIGQVHPDGVVIGELPGQGEPGGAAGAGDEDAGHQSTPVSLTSSRTASNASAWVLLACRPRNRVVEVRTPGVM